jgi:hypothetical protein
LAKWEFPQSGHVFVVEGGKLEVCLQQRVTHFIDDRPRNIAEFLDASYEHLANGAVEIRGVTYTEPIPAIYVRDFPYNRVAEVEDVRRVTSVAEFIWEVRNNG